jgi:3-oxoacyl-[acyl-carrier protein] reductase
MTSLQLRGKVAVVTGGARNIGRSIAIHLAREGAHIAIADIRHAKARQVARVVQQLGGKSLAICTDLRDEKQIEEMVRLTAEEFGRIDVLVNNAAWTEGESTPLDLLSVAQWDKMQEISLRGAFLFAKAVVPWMRRRGEGRIINISSVVFWIGMADCLDYMSAKGGIIGFTRGLARELGRWNINVNAVTPGAVKTPQEKRVASRAEVQRIVSAQCLKRRVMPEDIAKAVVFLASDLSSAITGQTINVDAGWAMH